MMKTDRAEQLGELLERHGDLILRVARRLTDSEADAEDVVQDVLVTVAQKAEQFRGESELATWLYRITVNTALMRGFAGSNFGIPIWRAKKVLAEAVAADRAGDSSAPASVEQPQRAAEKQ
mgnify:CR=1 FL=1